MKYLKQLLSIILCVAVLLTLCACGNNAPDETISDQTNIEQTLPVDVKWTTSEYFVENFTALVTNVPYGLQFDMTEFVSESIDDDLTAYNCEIKEEDAGYVYYFTFHVDADDNIRYVCLTDVDLDLTEGRKAGFATLCSRINQAMGFIDASTDFNTRFEVFSWEPIDNSMFENGYEFRIYDDGDCCVCTVSLPG